MSVIKINNSRNDFSYMNNILFHLVGLVKNFVFLLLIRPHKLAFLLDKKKDRISNHRQRNLLGVNNNYSQPCILLQIFLLQCIFTFTLKNTVISLNFFNEIYF